MLKHLIFKKKVPRFLLEKVEIPERFGISFIIHDTKPIQLIVEKPQKPKSNYSVTGIYMYDNKVFEYIDHILSLSREELEVTYVNNMYLE